jgi:hypothetical protein
VQGLRIELPHASLQVDEANRTALEEAMLKEWIKFRFGVFEEAGFVGDSRYPATFLEGEVELPNSGCNATTEVNQPTLLAHYNATCG